MKHLTRFLAIFFLLAAAPRISSATIFNVNVTNDPAPMDAPNGCSSSSINGGRCSLREAVIQSNSNVDDDTIMLGEGTYQLTQSGSGEDAAKTGDLDFTQANSKVSVVGLGPDKTTVDAAIMADRIFELDASFMTLSVSEMTLENGNAGSNPGNKGGVIGIGSAGNETINITNCRMQGNQAPQGGAVSITNTSVGVFSGVEFSNNNRSTSLNPFEGGGAIRVGESSNLTMSGGIITGNHSAADGGGILAVNSGVSTITGTVISQNEAAGQGGGVYASSGPVIDFDSCEIINNKAIDGGGLFIKNGGGGQIYHFQNSTIANNQASGDGGGINVNSGPSLFFSNSTVSGNTAAGNGGGFDTFFGAVVNLNNSTVSENSSVGSGGAFSGQSGVILNFRSSTISNNKTQGQAGGIFSKDLGLTVTIANSILAGNTANGAASDCDGVPTTTASGLVFTSGNYNLFGTLTPCAVTLATNDQNGVNDPGLNTLGDNGGKTETQLPTGTSPAIDRGNPGGCVDTDGAILTTDQRGQTRPVGAACDVGSVELGSSDLSISKTADATSVAVGDDLTYTVTVKNNGPNNNLNVTVSDTLPAGVTLVSATPDQGACNASNGTVDCDLGEIANGTSTNIEIVVTADTAGTITNTATVTGSELDPDNGNDSASVQTTVTGSNGGGGGGCGLAEAAPGAVSWGLSWMTLGVIGLGVFRRRR